MELFVQIPDDLAQRLSATGGDLSRRALEALAAEEYKQGRLTKPDLRRTLGLETSDQIDSFLKAHDVWLDYTIGDLERERAGLRRLGF
jgi:chromosome segregation and condensation protein ScpB